MITKEQIIDIARDELTPIGWYEEHAKYIDGLIYRMLAISYATAKILQ